MKDEFFLNISEVEISSKKIINYIEQQKSLIEKISNIFLQEINEGYSSTYNKHLNNQGATLVSQLNKVYKEQIDNYTLIKNDMNTLWKVKQENIRNTIKAEGEII